MTKDKATAKWRLEPNGDIVDAAGTVLLKVWNGYDHGVEAVTAVNERDQLLAEVARLRAAFQPLYTRVEKMMMDGPECDCPAEGHMCGWPDLQREMKAVHAALSSEKE